MEYLMAGLVFISVVIMILYPRQTRKDIYYHIRIEGTEFVDELVELLIRRMRND